MHGQRIHLDYALTTPLLPMARAVMERLEAWRGAVPVALHSGGLAARDALATAREQAAALLQAESPDDILFTSGGTEAVNLALKGLAWSPRRQGRHLVLTNAEHPAVWRTVAFLAEQGFTSTQVPVDPTGRVDPAAIAAAITADTLLVCVHHAGHDLGTIQPVAEIGEVARARGVPLFVDATASAGWIPLDVRNLPPALVALAPHRFYGPKGVGILYRHRRVPLASLIHGGDQEHGLRAGTENIPAIAGAGVAAAAAAREGSRRAAEARTRQQQLWDGLRATVDGIQLNGAPLGPGRSPLHLHLTVAGAEGEGLTLALDLQGVAIHAGAACVTRSLRLPPVLQAVGLTTQQARCSVLLSPGPETTADEIQRAVELFRRAVERLRDLGG